MAPRRHWPCLGFRPGSALLASSGRRPGMPLNTVSGTGRPPDRGGPATNVSGARTRNPEGEKSRRSLQPSGPKHFGFQRRSTWGFVLEKNLGSRGASEGMEGRDTRHRGWGAGWKTRSTPPTVPRLEVSGEGARPSWGTARTSQATCPPRAAQSGRPEGGGLSPALHSGRLLADPQGRTRVPAAGLAWP